MKKTLLATIYFPPSRGGISNSLWNVCMNLPPDKVVVLAEPSTITPRTPFPIIRKPILKTSRFIWPRWIWLLRDLKRIVEEYNIEIIQAGQILPIGTAALILKRLYHIPYHVYVYGQDLMIARRSSRKMRVIKKVLKHADGIIVNSQSTKKKAVNLGANPDKLIIIYPSPIGLIDTTIDQQYFDYFLHRYHFKHKKIILTVGNIVPRKGQDMIIKAMQKIIKNIPNARYVIVGTGDYLSNLRELVSDLRLTDFVLFYENVSDQELPYFYHACDVFAMVSREVKNRFHQSIDVEGFGIVYLEANLFGKPVIGGNSGGVPEAVADGISGLLVNPNDSNDITAKICKVLQDPYLANKLGQQGRERALKHFQWKDEMKKMKKLLGQ